MADLSLDWPGTSVTFATAFGATLLQALAFCTWLSTHRADQRWRVALPGTTLIIAVVAGMAMLLDALIGHLPVSLALLVIGGVLVIIGLCRISGAARSNANTAPARDEHSATSARQQRVEIADLLKVVATSIFEAAPLAAAVALTMIGVGTDSGLPRSAMMGTIAALLAALPLSVVICNSFSIGALRRQVLVAGAVQTALGTFWFGEGVGLKWYGSIPSAILLFTIYFVSAACTSPSASAADPSKQPGHSIEHCGSLIASILLWVGGIGLFITHADQPLRESWYSPMLLTAGLVLLLVRSVRQPISR